MFLFGKFLCHTINWSSANIPFSFMILRKSSRQILVHRFSIRRSTLKNRYCRASRPFRCDFEKIRNENISVHNVKET